MKYLVLLVVLVIAFGVWRSGRRTKVQQAAKPHRAPQIQDMVACAHCGLHLPRSEALQHSGHSYCSLAHQQQGPA